MIDKKTMEKFYEAWNFLNIHPAFERTWTRDGKVLCAGSTGKPYREVRFDEAMSMEVVKVQPRNRTVNALDDGRNSLVQVWLECGAWIPGKKLGYPSGEGAFGHDYRLDCGADTFEEAIIKLARLVRKHYGNKARNKS